MKQVFYRLWTAISLAAVSAVACGLIGCGAPEDGATEDLGTVEQAYTTPVTNGGGNRMLGVLFGGCSPLGVQAVSNTGNTCQFYVPQNVVPIEQIVVAMATPVDPTFKTAVQNAITFLNGAQTRFSLTLGPDGSSNGMVFAINHAPGVSLPKTNIHHYNGGSDGAGLQCGVLAQLTKVPSTLGGQFYPINLRGHACSFSVDVAEAKANYAGSALANVLEYAALNSLTKVIGLGDTGSDRLVGQEVPTYTGAIVSSDPHTHLVSGQTCLVNGYNVSSTTTWGETAGSCPAFPSGM